DLFPTVCDFIGAPIPGNVEGRSIVPVISGATTSVRETLFTGYRNGQRAITDGRWKLIRYPLIDKTQLFDLESDPREQNDLAQVREHADRIESLLSKLAQTQAEYADPAPLRVEAPRPAAWSPDKLTPEQLKYQKEETARSSGAASK
ncbi:MAG TPA: DUF4976 domain-containing protein, partial [Candidatus Hydrogenedentes bacterium]|nr:DUF4976 domain-containing protein [Candidatus Hydrogenedentota bacterium]